MTRIKKRRNFKRTVLAQLKNLEQDNSFLRTRQMQMFTENKMLEQKCKRYADFIARPTVRYWKEEDNFIKNGFAIRASLRAPDNLFNVEFRKVVDADIYDRIRLDLFRDITEGFARKYAERFVYEEEYEFNKQGWIDDINRT